MMARYYSLASLTLAVSRADGADEGCLNNRRNGQKVYAFPYYNERGIRDGRFWARKHTYFYDDVGTSPWYRRGWVLQERILSRRILYITKGSFYFWCRERTLTAEDGYNHEGSSQKPGLEGNGFRNVDISINRGSAPMYPRRSGDMGEEFPLSVFPEWMKLVEDYSAARLTRQSDKRVAISGLAVVYANALHMNEDIENRYAWFQASRATAHALRQASFNQPVLHRVTPAYSYGIWLADLKKQLLWRKDTSRGPDAPQEAGEISAPSWSWMAWKTPVCYPMFASRSIASGATAELIAPVKCFVLPVRANEMPQLREHGIDMLSSLSAEDICVKESEANRIVLDTIVELELAGHMATVNKEPFAGNALRTGLTSDLLEWICMWDIGSKPVTETQMMAYSPISVERRSHKRGFLPLLRATTYKESIGWGCFEEAATEESFAQPVCALYISNNEGGLNGGIGKEYGPQSWHLVPIFHGPESLDEEKIRKMATWNVIFLRPVVDARPDVYRRVGMGQITARDWIDQFAGKAKRRFVLR
jgi:hypothetical protein